MNPFPTPWTMLDGKKLKIYQAKKGVDTPLNEPGNFTTDGKYYLRFFTLDGFVEVEDLQLQGKKRMAIKDFLNGYQFED